MLLYKGITILIKPLQDDGVYMFKTPPSWTSKNEKRPNTSSLAKRSATWFSDATCKVQIMPSWTLPHIRWQSNSKYFVLLWNMGLAAIRKDAWLSQKSKAALSWSTDKSQIK